LDRRWLLARRPDLSKRLLRIGLEQVRRFLVGRARERGLEGGRTGSVTVVQRFGSALNLNVHFHTLMLDGVYVRGKDGELHFHRDLPPSTEDVERLVESIAEAPERMFEREGFGRDGAKVDVDPEDGWQLASRPGTGGADVQPAAPGADDSGFASASSCLLLGRGDR
jgi:hypothetical protein